MSRLFELTEAPALVRDTARNYAQKTLAPPAARLHRERRFPRQQIAELAELGVMGVNIPQGYGGARTGVEGPKGISCFLVEGGAKGLHVGRHEDKMGLRASSTVSLAFEDVRVPASAMLGPDGRGFSIALAGLDSGRIGIACQAIGIATAALDSAVRYAKERNAFGQPIAT